MVFDKISSCSPDTINVLVPLFSLEPCLKIPALHGSGSKLYFSRSFRNYWLKLFYFEKDAFRSSFCWKISILSKALKSVSRKKKPTFKSLPWRYYVLLIIVTDDKKEYFSWLCRGGTLFLDSATKHLWRLWTFPIRFNETLTTQLTFFSYTLHFVFGGIDLSLWRNFFFINAQKIIYIFTSFVHVMYSFYNEP